LLRGWGRTTTLLQPFDIDSPVKLAIERTNFAGESEKSVATGSSGEKIAPSGGKSARHFPSIEERRKRASGSPSCLPEKTYIIESSERGSFSQVTRLCGRFEG
jgi:hypothetical protein